MCTGGTRSGFFNHGGTLCLELLRRAVDNVSDLEPQPKKLDADAILQRPSAEEKERRMGFI